MTVPDIDTLEIRDLLDEIAIYLEKDGQETRVSSFLTRLLGDIGMVSALERELGHLP